MNYGIKTATSKFRQEYSGPKIAFFIAGGGFSALEFRRFPGSSKMYHTAIEPYNVDTANFLTQFANESIDDPEGFPFVNPDGTAKALQALQNYCDRPSLLFVIVNAALTTDRFRRGENRAYILTSRGDMYLMKLNKLSEQEYASLRNTPGVIDNIRKTEDAKVGQATLAIIMNDPSMLPSLDAGEEIIRMHYDAATAEFTENAQDIYARG